MSKKRKNRKVKKSAVGFQSLAVVARVNGVTLSWIAEEAGVSKSYLSKMIHGERRVPEKVMSEILAALAKRGIEWTISS